MLELLGMQVQPVEHYHQLASMDMSAPIVPIHGNIYSVNLWVNKLIKYKVDYADHWQSPRETLWLGTGDCEDYAILKYTVLQQLGYQPYLVQVPNHMVVVVNGYVLDNKRDTIIKWEHYKWHPFKIHTDEVTYTIMEKAK